MTERREVASDQRRVPLSGKRETRRGKTRLTQVDSGKDDLSDVGIGDTRRLEELNSVRDWEDEERATKGVSEPRGREG